MEAKQGSSNDSKLRMQMQECIDQAAPMRHDIAGLIYGILEDFVEEEDDGEKSPVVEDLESTCQLMTQIPSNQDDSIVGFIPNDYSSLVKTFNAFRELLVAATTMAQEAVQHAQAQGAQMEADSAASSKAKAQDAAQALSAEKVAALQGEHQEKVSSLQKQISDLEESLHKAKDVAKTARDDVGEVKQQLRRCKHDNEQFKKKAKEKDEHVEQVEKDLKHTKGQLDQIKLQKREAYNKSRKVQGEREAHVKQIQDLKDNAENIRKEMELRLLSTCREQEEYTNVMCELRSKLERELSQLQHEHQLAEENNTALMEDRVNLIAQLTQTKIESQEAMRKNNEEWEEKLKEGTSDTVKECEEMKEKMAEMTKANEQTLAEAEDHRQTCEKYRIDLEATLQRVSEQAEEITRLEATSAECEELRSVLKKQKEEFDNELSELQNTVERMEQNAAKREQAMAERAEEALERAISHARAEASKQSEEAMAKALRDAQFQNEMMHGDAEDKLQQALQHIQVVETELDTERTQRFEMQQKLDHCRQQVVEGRQRVVQAEEAEALLRSEVLRHSSVNERAAQVHAVSEDADRRFGSLPNGRPGSRPSSPTKDGGGQVINRLKKMRRAVDKENDVENHGRRPGKDMKGALMSYAQRSSSQEQNCYSPVKADRSVSQDIVESPGMQRRSSAKMERMATLQRLKQRH